MNKTLETTIKKIIIATNIELGDKHLLYRNGDNLEQIRKIFEKEHQQLLSAFTEMLERAIPEEVGLDNFGEYTPGEKKLSPEMVEVVKNTAVCMWNSALDQFKQNLRTEAGIIIK